MQPDFILIAVLLFYSLGMLVSCRDSRRWRLADLLGSMFGISRNHNESCLELRGRIHAHQLDALRAPSAFANAMSRASEAAMSFDQALENFHKNRKVIHNK